MKQFAAKKRHPFLSHMLPVVSVLLALVVLFFLI